MSLTILVFASILFVVFSTSFISHTYDLPKKVSETSNIINLDFLDNSAFDFRYESQCQECKCFIKDSTLSPEVQTQISFDTEIDDSFLNANRLYAIHKTESDEVKYSIFEIIPPKTLREIRKEIEIPSFKGFKYITFASSDNSFVGFSQGSLIINKIDDQGQIQEKKYLLASDQNSKEIENIYDIKYTGGLLFLAKGELGIEILKIKNDELPDLEMISLSLQDLEVNEGSKVIKLDIDSKKKILYAVSSNSNHHDCLLTLDFNDNNEISLLNNYHFENYTIVDVKVDSNHVHMTSKNEEEKFYYIQLSSVSESIYDDLDLNKLWEIPLKVENIHYNLGKILIDANDYLYLFTKDFDYETERSELLINTLVKKSQGDFFPFNQEDSNYLISTESTSLKLFSVPQLQKTLQCGIFKPDYAGTVSFIVDVFQDFCEGVSSNQDGAVCLQSYRFDVDFRGTEYKEFPSNSLIPTPLHTSKWQDFTSPPLVNGTVTHEPTPPQPTQTPETPETPETPKTPETPETTETPSNSENPKNNQSNNEKNSTTDGDFPIRRPDLIEPDAPYYDRLNSTYALILVGLIVITCFGCLIKCLCDFVKISKNKIKDQFSHKPLEEDEEGEQNSNGGIDIKDQLGKASDKDTAENDI